MLRSVRKIDTEQEVLSQELRIDDTEPPKKKNKKAILIIENQASCPSVKQIKKKHKKTVTFLLPDEDVETISELSEQMEITCEETNEVRTNRKHE